MDEPIQGYDATYRKLDKDPVGGHEIYPTWYVTLSGPFEVSAICELYLEMMVKGKADESGAFDGRIMMYVKQLAEKEVTNA